MLIPTDCGYNEADLPSKLHNIPPSFKLCWQSLAGALEACWILWRKVCSTVIQTKTIHSPVYYEWQKRIVHKELLICTFNIWFISSLYPNHRSIQHWGNLTVLSDRFNCSCHTFPCYISSNLICMKIELMFYLFLPSETTYRSPLGVMICTYWTKTKKKR